MLNRKLKKIIAQTGQWPLAMLLATLPVHAFQAQTSTEVPWPAAACANCDADAADNANKEKASRDKKDKPHREKLCPPATEIPCRARP